MHTLRLFFCLLLLAVQAAIAPQVDAQGVPIPAADENSVVGFSFIAPVANGQLTVYSVTEMDVNVAGYYDAYVEAQVQGATQQPSAVPVSNPTAEGIFSISAAAAQLTVYSYHYLYCDQIENNEDNLVYADPMGFSTVAGQGYGQNWFEVTAPYSGDALNPYSYSSSETIYLGMSTYTGYGEAPIINGISVSGTGYLTLNSSGTLTIAGLYLSAGGTDQNPTVTPTGANGAAGLTLGSAQVVSDGGNHEYDSLEVPYSVGNTANGVGTYGITVTTTAGTSNQYNVTVGDPTPVITASSISPQPWYAQNSPISITITGQGFGTNPQLSVTGGGVTAAVPTGVSSDGTIMTASVTIAANTQGGYATVTVTSQGYGSSCGGGSCWVQAQPGQSATSNSEQVQVIAEALPVPQIIYYGSNAALNGTNVAGQTVGVYAGDRIDLSAVIPGITPTSQSWSQVQQAHSGLGTFGTAVGGFADPSLEGVLNQPTANAGSVIELPSTYTCETLLESCLTLFWVDQGTWQWEYTYTYANQNQSATVTFNVLGPPVANPEIATQVGSAQAKSPSTLYLLGVPSPIQGYQVGILFQTPALPAVGNGGTYQWVQIIANDQYQLRTSGGQLSCSAPSGYPALDNNYPCGTPGGNIFSVNRPNDTATDGPGLTLKAAWGEAQRYFSATMYLMWDPTLPAGCTAAAQTSASTCRSIPVPLASIAWQFTGDGINTLQNQANGTTWVVPCGPGSASQCATVAQGTDPGQSFPQWNKVFMNGTYTCK